MHIGSIPGDLCGIQEMLEADKGFGSDEVVHDDPYHGSSLTPDLAIVVQVFHQRLAGIAGNTAHQVDTRAATPGLIINVPIAHAEGMLLAGAKLHRKGNIRRYQATGEMALLALPVAQALIAGLGAVSFIAAGSRNPETATFDKTLSRGLRTHR